jgi:hypothetical protein
MPKVSLTQELPVRADDVWAAIGRFNAVAEWHPAVEKCETERAGDDEIRHLSLLGGGSIVERLEKHDDRTRSYSYEILSPGPLPVRNYHATITVKDADIGCEIVWSSSFEAEGADDDAATAAVRGIYEAGFETLRNLFGAG